MVNDFDRDVCVVGGGGHVGLPLAMAWADAGLRTVIYDSSSEKVKQIRAGQMPFLEEGADAMLASALASGRLEVEDSPGLMSRCRFVLFVIGTPVDAHLNPTFAALDRALAACRSELRDGQILIVRSTVYPGTSARLQRYLREQGLKVDVTCCPERVAQGQSLREFRTLPQIVSAFDPAALVAVKGLFGHLAPSFVELTPLEAELCKLMTNAWRYIQFAAVNQFYMLASDHDVDFDRVLHGCRFEYPRMAMMPGPGLTAGPCLVKDTMQLAAFSQNQFMLGHAAMLVNEGLPAHLVAMAQKQGDLSTKTVAVLGMAFKAESDDMRDSLSYKLKHLLSLECREVLCTDPYVPDDRLVPLEQAVSRADILFVGTPHAVYRKLAVPPEKVVVDVWGCLPQPAGNGDKA
jgi:UDP-N-acetyl-D-mannosaminuronic acid dehydrogenase